jgi:hypothetical protein
MYEYEIAKIILALWIGLNLTYGSLVIGLVIGSRCAKFIGVGLKRIRISSSAPYFARNALSHSLMTSSKTASGGR